ncbi:hypothetical protein RUM43_007824 [Polyplax serrata]|uniref:Uncharacterized protein n=1 Tax=Polyplax serrata TaxID=468196 RepID=A0AAN8PDR6_POLSC
MSVVEAHDRDTAKDTEEDRYEEVIRRSVYVCADRLKSVMGILGQWIVLKGKGTQIRWPSMVFIALLRASRPELKDKLGRQSLEWTLQGRSTSSDFCSMFLTHSRLIGVV